MARKFPAKSDFEKEVVKFSELFGGFKNLHVHGDRAFTNKDEYYEDVGLPVSDIARLSLPEKQKLTWVLHNGKAFEPECIEQRFRRLLDESIKFGVTQLNTTADVCESSGLKSFEIIEKLKEEYDDKIKVKIGAYNPRGFRKTGEKNAEKRFELFEEASRRADFLVALGEKDRGEKKIGEEAHNVFMALKAYELGIPCHYHGGQENRPTDKGVDLLLDNLEFVQKNILRVSPEEYSAQANPIVVHDISTACYNEEERKNHIRRMKDLKVGLYVCPSAAISMKQDRTVLAPVHNCIAPVCDYILGGVKVEGMGIDNISDIYMSSNSPDPYDEGWMITHGIRVYSPRLVAKLLCGSDFDEYDKGSIRRDGLAQ